MSLTQRYHLELDHSRLFWLRSSKQNMLKVGCSQKCSASHIHQRNATAYFDHIHPIFPFLVKREFEQQITEHRARDALETDASFFVLYHAVQAIGSQYSGNGAFEPGKGQSWQLFQTALDRLQELIGSRPCLESVQVGSC